MDDQGVIDDFNWSHAMYALEKLSESVGILATGEGDARSRILAASRYFFRVAPTWLPPTGDMRTRFNRALKLLTKYSPPPWNDELRPDLRYTDFTYTMTRIRNSTASKAATDLFTVWLELSDVCQEHVREAFDRAGAGVGDVVIIDDIPPLDS